MLPFEVVAMRQLANVYLTVVSMLNSLEHDITLYDMSQCYSID